MFPLSLKIPCQIPLPTKPYNVMTLPSITGDSLVEAILNPYPFTQTIQGAIVVAVPTQRDVVFQPQVQPTQMFIYQIK